MGWFAKIVSDEKNNKSIKLVDRYVIEDEGEFVTIVHTNNTEPFVEDEEKDDSTNDNK